MPLDPLEPSDSLGNMPLTPALQDWTRRNVLSAGSLLGKSCQGTLALAGHGIELQKQGFLFGKHLSLAWQVNYFILYNCYLSFFNRRIFLIYTIL